MVIREVTKNDISEWLMMRSDLWPLENHLAAIQNFLGGSLDDINKVFVAQYQTEIAGFIELSIRNFAEGSQNSQVPYVEGWYVKPRFQQKGLAKQLMQKAEEWAISNGFTELASDTQTHNTKSITIHKHLGFSEAERVVCFIKQLT